MKLERMPFEARTRLLGRLCAPDCENLTPAERRARRRMTALLRRTHGTEALRCLLALLLGAWDRSGDRLLDSWLALTEEDE